MIDSKQNLTAIVRAVPDSFQGCVTTFNNPGEIDVGLAKRQHQIYCDILSLLGLTLINLNADNDLPDCCFVEDNAIVVDNIAIITFPGAPSRIPETVEIERALASRKKLFHLVHPAHLDGGDVLRIEKKIFVGISTRTNEEGVRQVASILNPYGYEIVPIRIRNTLHLKSVCTYLGDGFMVISQGHFDDEPFQGFKKIIIPVGEDYAANTLTLNGKVLMPAGFEKTKSLIKDKGFEVIPLEMTEFKKADGALTCISIIL
jgi:dimethylargininase